MSTQPARRLGAFALVAIVSATLGASAAFLIARRLARAPYAALAGQRLRGWTARIAERGFVAVLYARIAPGVPFALLSYAAGMTRIRLRDFAPPPPSVPPPARSRTQRWAAASPTTPSPGLVAIGVLILMTLGGAALLWRSRIAR